MTDLQVSEKVLIHPEIASYVLKKLKTLVNGCLLKSKYLVKSWPQVSQSEVRLLVNSKGFCSVHVYLSNRVAIAFNVGHLLRGEAYVLNEAGLFEPAFTGDWAVYEGCTVTDLEALALIGESYKKQLEGVGRKKSWQTSYYASLSKLKWMTAIVYAVGGIFYKDPEIKKSKCFQIPLGVFNAKYLKTTRKLYFNYDACNKLFKQLSLLRCKSQIKLKLTNQYLTVKARGAYDAQVLIKEEKKTITSQSLFSFDCDRHELKTVLALKQFHLNYQIKTKMIEKTAKNCIYAHFSWWPESKCLTSVPLNGVSIIYRLDGCEYSDSHLMRTERELWQIKLTALFCIIEPRKKKLHNLIKILKVKYAPEVIAWVFQPIQKHELDSLSEELKQYLLRWSSRLKKHHDLNPNYDDAANLYRLIGVSWLMYGLIFGEGKVITRLYTDTKGIFSIITHRHVVLARLRDVVMSARKIKPTGKYASVFQRKSKEELLSEIDDFDLANLASSLAMTGLFEDFSKEVEERSIFQYDLRSGDVQADSDPSQLQEAVGASGLESVNYHVCLRLFGGMKLRKKGVLHEEE